jgi:SAM-dependent methyltransferase
MPIEMPGREDNYVMDTKNGAEMARLIDQHQLFTKHMGGLFPLDVDLSTIHDVLDLACGPGSWVQDVAFEHMDIDVTGVDISKAMVDYARTMARVQGLDNAHFEIMDIRQRLDFFDDTFDFVNIRFLSLSLSPAEWPGLLAECKRVLKPGGILRLTEADDGGITNSLALEHLADLSVATFRKLGRTFFPSGRFSGTMPMIGPLLRKAGFQDIHQEAHVIDWSSGTKAHNAQFHNMRAMMAVGREFMLGTKAIAPEEYDALCEQAELEMYSEDFCATLIYLSAWGKADKPII